MLTACWDVARACVGKTTTSLAEALVWRKLGSMWLGLGRACVAKASILVAKTRVCGKGWALWDKGADLCDKAQDVYTIWKDLQAARG